MTRDWKLGAWGAAVGGAVWWIGLVVAVEINRTPPAHVTLATQAARLAAFERCVESASRSGPATFSPGDVVRACRDAAVELVADDPVGPPERGERP